jgi:hypothetical protein
MNRGVTLAMMMVCLSAGMSAIASAETIATLTDENTTVRFQLDSAGVGMNEWVVDGVDRLREQSFWYRVGNTPQKRVNSLRLSSWTLTEDNKLATNYVDPSNRFTVQLTFVVTGSSPGSGSSDILESVKVKNTSGASLDFHLYEYVDVDLLGLTSPIDSTLQLTGIPVQQATQTNGPVNLSETVVTPAPSRYQAASASQLLGKLSANSVYNLNNNVSAVNADLAWAFQWDKTLANNGTLLVSKDKLLSLASVPEPSCLALLGTGAIGLLGYGWRRRRQSGGCRPS